MKINDLSTSLKGVKQSPHSEHIAHLEKGQKFTRQLTDIKKVHYEKHFIQLTEDIYAQGKKMAARADIKELQKYREMITDLMHETVSNSFAFRKESAFDANGRHRVYAIVNKVNQKLEEITEEVLKEESNNIALLNAVDDIRGLLVDLML